MTNLQSPQANKIRLTPSQVLLWGPMVLSCFVSILISWAIVYPALSAYLRDREQLNILKEQQARLPMLRSQSVKQQDLLDRQKTLNHQIVSLIAGSGDISTFLSQLNVEADRSGVRLDGYEPLSTLPEDLNVNKQKETNPQKNKESVVNDPLLAPGLEKIEILLKAQGDGRKILDFLRRLEALSLLVVQSDLSVKVSSNASSKSKVEAPELSLRLGLYRQSAGLSPGQP